MQSENDQKLSPDSRVPLQGGNASLPSLPAWNPQNEAFVCQELPPVPLVQGRYHVIYDGSTGNSASVTPSPQTGSES